MTKRLLLLALLLTGLTATSDAQTLSGTITGTVSDAQGAVLPGATVTLTGRTGSQTTVSDESGVFRFVGLNPGPYADSGRAVWLQQRTRKKISTSASAGRLLSVSD